MTDNHHSTFVYTSRIPCHLLVDCWKNHTFEKLFITWIQCAPVNSWLTSTHMRSTIISLKIIRFMRIAHKACCCEDSSIWNRVIWHHEMPCHDSISGSLLCVVILVSGEACPLLRQHWFAHYTLIATTKTRFHNISPGFLDASSKGYQLFSENPLQDCEGSHV